MEYLYRLEAKIISRSKGHNALAAAAYRSGTLLQETSASNLPNKFTGVADQNEAPVKAPPKSLSHDYRRRHGVISDFIMAPKDTPAWAQNRQEIWNKVEKSETRKDSQLAREIVLTLPDVDIFDHLKPANKAKALQKFYESVLRTYVKHNFVKEGMIADVVLHEPAEKNDERNYHAHIMLTMRKVNGKHATGFSEKKERSWNSEAMLEKWRENWAMDCTTHMKRHNIDGFIDHRSYEERGLSIAVTKPEGAQNRKKERAGVVTPVVAENRKISNQNKVNHKYLERVFEFNPLVSTSKILASIKKSGNESPEEELERLEQEGLLSRSDTDLWAYAPMMHRAEMAKAVGQSLHRRDSYRVPEDIVEKAKTQCRFKVVKDALDFTAGQQGFKAVQINSATHKTKYLEQCRKIYGGAGYDIITVARNNEGKASFHGAGFDKGVLTYKDFLRRFGDRYKGKKNTKKKIIFVDDASGLSTLQDSEIFKLAKKLDAKLVYVANQNTKSKSTWQNLFSFYRNLTSLNRLKDSFRKARKDNEQRMYDAITKKKKGRAKFLNSYSSAALAKQGTLDMWFKRMKRRHDNRFILTARDRDAELLNFAIQNKRLEKKHLTEKYGKAFSVSYPSDNGGTLRRDMFVYWGDQIQFKKKYKEHGIEAGTRATVRIHYTDHSVLELDDGRIVKMDLRKHSGFDLGYAGSSLSEKSKPLDQGFIYHSKANALDDAPLLYEKSKQAVRLFYDENMVENREELSSQLLSQHHDLYGAFTKASGNDGNNNQNIDVVQTDDDNLEIEPDELD